MTDLLKQLSIETGLPEYTVKSIISNAPDRYKEYYIKKKNGGSRLIAQPARELKLIQRAFVDILLSKLPVHSAATAYRKGKSIRDNALPHSHSGPILKLDFKDFFPSITESDWVAYCKHTKCLTDPNDVRLSSLLLFHRPSGGRLLRLAIGAPSSPVLSNIIMFPFDEAISAAVAHDHVIYSRYADDLTFSGPRTGHLTGVSKAVKKALREIPYPTLKINHEKTTHVTMKYHRKVTGLTLSNDGRVTIGRDNKRTLRAQLHHYLSGKLNESEVAHLAGRIAFVKSVEPSFYFTLIERHSDRVIQMLLTKSNQKHAKEKRQPISFEGG
ncbi:retron St85 family RNA-directed DNA polymerase [Rhizobium multihospitium]|uniref:RNA-directed DNA polymerase n=1 Tax=Rhizobium multihospitium TaxID=410764 RepID=A0A1C3UTD8_9HYPH|nr:retron St85 family RNA-directed DNA polymerase [Rhizobium multihospitium]SCB18732.1 Reverse transcriptase (RNA-dependent DNA polymerase) [Rhizobium multihospitium]